MGKCPNCGNKGLFLSTKNCLVCGRESCEKCFDQTFKIQICQYGMAYHREEATVVFCSEDCYEKFVHELVVDFPHQQNVGVDAHAYASSGYFWGAIAQVASKFDSSFLQEARRIIKHQQYVVKAPTARAIDGLQDLHGKFKHKAALALGRNLETTGRFSEAAKLYESLRMYDEAGRMRRKYRQVTVKKTDVSVDLNKLLQQIKSGGIIAIYRCSHCGGKLKVDKDATVKSLKVCEHCGTEIEAMELADFLKTVLS